MRVLIVPTIRTIHDVMRNHFISRITICFVSRFNHSIIHVTLNHLRMTQSRPRALLLIPKPGSTGVENAYVCVNSCFTKTITQQRSRPFDIKLDHFAHGILFDLACGLRRREIPLAENDVPENKVD